MHLGHRIMANAHLLDAFFGKPAHEPMDGFIRIILVVSL